MKNFHEIDQAIKAVCPILGISYGRLDDKSTWVINYAEGATDAQKQAAFDLLMKQDVVELPPVPDPVEARIALLEAKVAQLDTSIGVLVK